MKVRLLALLACVCATPLASAADEPQSTDYIRMQAGLPPLASSDTTAGPKLQAATTAAQPSSHLRGVTSLGGLAAPASVATPLTVEEPESAPTSSRAVRSNRTALPTGAHAHGEARHTSPRSAGSSSNSSQRSPYQRAAMQPVRKAPNLEALATQYQATGLGAGRSENQESLDAAVRTADVQSDDTLLQEPASPRHNTLRQQSPLPASSLASPSSPIRLSRTAQRELVGAEAEYHQRDSFSYSVLGETKQPSIRTARALPSTAGGRSGISRAAATYGERNTESKPDAAEKSFPAPDKRDQDITRGAQRRRTAPSRWFRTNPLRESALAAAAPVAQPVIQRTSGEIAAAPGESIPPAASQTNYQAPDEEPFPFDIDEAVKPEQAKSAPAKEATESDAAAPADDLPFDLPSLPDDAPTTSAPEKTAPSNPAADPALDDLFPDSPAQSPAKPATPEAAPAKPEPAPADPALDAPATPQEEMPADAPRNELPPPEDAPADALFPPAAESAAQAQPEDTVAARELQFKPIIELTTSIVPPAGDLPNDRSLVVSSEPEISYPLGHASRGWATSNYHWEATAMCHQPLYFEEVNLERYGYSYGIAQPAISYGHFLLNVVAMPYKYVAEPSRECVYTLGHYRPGSYAPYRVHYPPRSAAGGMFEAGVILGLVFLIP